MLYEPWMDVGFCANAAITREHLLAGLLSAPVMILGVSPISHTVIRQSASFAQGCEKIDDRSEEHTSELQSLMRISYAVFCLKKKKIIIYILENRNNIYLDTTYN